MLFTAEMFSFIDLAIMSTLKLTGGFKCCGERDTRPEGVETQIDDLKYVPEYGRSSGKGTGLRSYAYLFTTTFRTDVANHNFSEHEEPCGHA